MKLDIILTSILVPSLISYVSASINQNIAHFEQQGSVAA